VSELEKVDTELRVANGQKRGKDGSAMKKTPHTGGYKRTPSTVAT